VRCYIKTARFVNGTRILGSPGTGRNTAGVACRRWIASEPERCVGAFLRVAAMRHTRIARGKTWRRSKGRSAQWGTRRGKMRWDRTEDGPGEKWGTKKGEWDTREEWDRRGRETERRARVLSRSERKRGECVRRCRTCRRTMPGIQAEGWAANQLSKAKPRVYPENNRTYRPASAWASHRRNMHS